MSNDLFKYNELAQTVFNSKYSYKNETLDEFFNRLINTFYRDQGFDEDLSEYGKQRSELDYKEVLSNLLYNFKHIVLGGSVLAGAGTEEPVSLSNCFVVKTGDSVSEIFTTAKNMANIYKRRGGVGVDMTVIRPNGSKVNNAAKTTSGVVPFMELFSQTTRTIGQEGRRR